MSCSVCYDSPVGELILTSEDGYLTGLSFGKKEDAGALSEPSPGQQDLETITLTKKWLDLYFSGQNPDFFPKMKVNATSFRQLVADIMLEIPYGKLVTYGDIAREVMKRSGKERMSAQAIGGAVGANPIAIIIPCHRVIGGNGSMTGYGGGMERKIFLLTLEGHRIEQEMIREER